MTVDPAVLFGTDMRLLVDLERGDQRSRGRDLVVTVRPVSSAKDLVPVTGVPNLQQALLLRFLTQTGELTHLGHPLYGSRLHELIGHPDTETTRNRARLYALQALTAEPRVAQVRSVVVTSDRRRPGWLDIRASVVAIDEPVPLDVVVGVDLTGGA